MPIEAVLEDALKIMNKIFGDGLEVQSKALVQIGQFLVERTMESDLQLSQIRL